MLDKYSIHWVSKPLHTLALLCARTPFSANQITLVGFVLGLGAAWMIAMTHYQWGLVLILLNRLFDGLDGALARIRGISDAGGFLDICLDFLFYSLIPLAFIFANPQQHALAGAVLMFSFVGTGSSFLAFAAVAGKRGIESPIYKHKSLFYMQGLTEGSETIICFVLMCLLPQYFSELAYGFAALCALTTFTRISGGFDTLRKNP